MVEQGSGFRVLIEASGQMSVQEMCGEDCLPALSTNETGLMLLGGKAMAIEAFDGLLFASCYFIIPTPTSTT